MNNEYVQIHELANCHVGPWLYLRLAFENFTAHFYQRCKQETTRSTVKYFILPTFSLSGKSNYGVEEFSAERQRAVISWDHYLPPKVRRVVGIPCQFFIECTPTPYFVWKQCNLTFKQKAKINKVLIYEL